MNKNLIGTKCRRGFTIISRESMTGFYLGTVDEIGLPNCRCSKYFESKEELESSAIRERDCIENDYCNGGQGCFVA